MALKDGGTLVNHDYKRVKEYMESQFDCPIMNIKPEQHFDDLGFEVTVWNVKTKSEGSWWVVDGKGLPMNLYTQDENYFSADEAYSFHLGLMERVMHREITEPFNVVGQGLHGIEMTFEIHRKLSEVASVLDRFMETESIQKTGLCCREALIILSNHLFDDSFLEKGEEKPKGSDFVSKSEIILRNVLSGSSNQDLRAHIKKLAKAAWDFSNQTTHSTSKTYYDASICLTLTKSVISTFENLFEKHSDVFCETTCSECGSRKLKAKEIDDKLHLVCEICDMEYDFEEMIKKFEE